MSKNALLMPTFDVVKTFDRTKMISAGKKAERTAMIRQLAFVRRTAMQNVLRRRKKSSQPGKPPSVHAKGAVSLKKIFFEYDPTTNSGIVGPVKLNGSRFAVKSRNPVPQVLEHGGRVIHIEENIGGRWTLIRRSRRSTRKTSKRQRKVLVRPRPFMQKALEIEVKKGTIVSAWQGTFTE